MAKGGRASLEPSGEEAADVCRWGTCGIGALCSATYRTWTRRALIAHLLGHWCVDSMIGPALVLHAARRAPSLLGAREGGGGRRLHVGHLWNWRPLLCNVENMDTTVTDCTSENFEVFVVCRGHARAGATQAPTWCLSKESILGSCKGIYMTWQQRVDIRLLRRVYILATPTSLLFSHVSLSWHGTATVPLSAAHGMPILGFSYLPLAWSNM